MRIALAPRRLLLLRLPRTTVYSALEILLLTLLAVQCARLFWTLVTPVDPVGDWRSSSAMQAIPASGSLLGFDPFFRLSAPAGTLVVSTLDLKLYGVREDRATGRGSAIIATPDGQQNSYVVGEEIMPGATLATVRFDHVTISRGGAIEQIFLDQSSPAPAAVTVAPGLAQPVVTPIPTVVAPPVTTPAPPNAGAAAQQIQFQPRINGDQSVGIVVQPQGSGEAFRAAGFAPGDVIVSVNGQRITSADQARSLVGQSGGAVDLIVERGGRNVPLRVGGGR